MKPTLFYLNKNLFIVLFILLAGMCNAQTVRKHDIIRLRDNTKLEVIIQEVLENTVKYKKLSDPEGPVFTINKSEIASIQYGNGEVENFEATLEAPNYYSPSQQNQSQPYTAPGPVARNKFEEGIQKATPDRLRTIYKYYKSKSKTGMVMGIAGVSVGVLAAGIGTGIVAASTDANGNYLTYQDQQRAITGAWMMVGGFATATTFGLVGFIKAGKNGSKASRIKRELLRRHEPLAFNISPGYNPVSQAGYLTLSVKF